VPRARDCVVAAADWLGVSLGRNSEVLFADTLGVGRFIKIGIPAPQFFAPFVGVVEIVCGGLLIVGFLTRLAAIPLLIDISVAIRTKTPCSEVGTLGRGSRSPDGYFYVAGVAVFDHCGGRGVSGDGKLAQIKKSPMYRRRSGRNRRFLATEVAWNDMPQRMCFGARGRLVA